MKKKKGFNAIEVIIVLVVGALAAFVMIKGFTYLFGKETGQASDFIDSSGDFDGDGIANLYDKCVCESGDDANEGCPQGTEIKGENAIKREQECRKKIKGMT